METIKSVRHRLAKEGPAMALITYPISVFILGHLLFDWIGAPFAIHVLQAAGSVSAGVNPNEAISDAHVWAATAHLYLLVSLFVLVALFRWMWSRARGRIAFFYLSIAAFLGALGIAFLTSVDIQNRPLKAIFLLTFRSLQLDQGLDASNILGFVSNVLTTINALGVVVPAVFCALIPLLVREPDGSWTEKDLVLRVKDVRMLAVVASVFLVAGVLHMYAWMSWAPELLNKDGLETVVASVTFYWGSVFTMMLAAYYYPVLLVLQDRAEAVMDAQQVPLIERDQWLQRRGLSVRISNQIPQVIGILGPLIAAPIGQFLANLSELVPQ